MINLVLGDCLKELPNLAENSIDSLVTDPPAGIGFMQKDWDTDKGGRRYWINWMTNAMTECLRVMKPGAYGLVWTIPRTSHWTAMALEWAGFEIRDVIVHLFSTGFPKSLNIGKSFDKALGTQQTDPSKQWDGWGTALKPAAEHWILVQKPISEINVVANVLKWGVGGINIDGCRVGIEQRINKPMGTVSPLTLGDNCYNGKATDSVVNGRFPANLVLSHDEDCGEKCTEECAPKLLDEQSFTGASRFFYCAKPSVSEREMGLEEREPEIVNDGRDTPIDNPFQRGETKRLNVHPTVKSLKLMTYLTRLVTPPNGHILDPFLGSGTIAMVAKKEGFSITGMEISPEYLEIARSRVLSV